MMASSDAASCPPPSNVFSSPLDVGTEDEGSECCALIILNSPIRSPPSQVFSKLWNRSSFRICADGGANRLYTAFDDSERESFIPECIKGDLDSLRPDVREYYSAKGTTIEQDPCQDTNDLDKVLQECISKQFTRIYVYGAFGGRFDQEMASFQALYNWSAKFANQLYLYSDETCAFLIPAQLECEIRLPFYKEDPPKGALGEGPTCGLIPLACRCESITTKGLQWDLDGSVAMEFGGLVSTSNRMMASVVTLKASHPIIFTAEVFSGSPQ